MYLSIHSFEKDFIEFFSWVKRLNSSKKQGTGVLTTDISVTAITNFARLWVSSEPKGGTEVLAYLMELGVLFLKPLK